MGASMLVLAAILLAEFAKADVSARRAVPLLRRTHPDARHPFATEDGRVPLLVELPKGVRAEQRGLLAVAPGFGALHLKPAQLEPFTRQNADLPFRVAPLRRLWLDVSGQWTQVPAYRSLLGYDGSGVVIGIIDTGIDVSHPDFLDENGKTRVAWVFERRPPLALHPQLEATYGCTAANQSPCAIWSAANIDERLATDPSQAPRDPEGHGTHVASIAAGNGGISASETQRYVGVAPGSTLIVAAPGATAGFSDPDILNAARFIFDRADDLGMPAVVNVSLGSDFGPHDGTSALERGLAAMVGNDKPGRVLVVAAGNSGALYHFDEHGPFGAHTEAHISSNAVTRVPLMIPAYEGTVNGAGFVWVTFRPGDSVQVGLEGPGGEQLVGLVAPGDDDGHQDDRLNVAIINNKPGESVEIPADSNSAVIAWEGNWDAEQPFAIQLRGRGDAQLWVTGTGDAAAGGLSVGLSFMRATRFGTVAVPATHPDLIAVGCTLNRISWVPLGSINTLTLASFGGVENPIADSVCYFSGAGPTATGLLKPDISAPGAFVAGALAYDADPRVSVDSIFNQPGCPDAEPCHLVDTRHALTSGTSMSAPHVAGAVALLLQADPGLNQAQMMEILQAGAGRPQGNIPYDYQLGAGALNMMGALQVLTNSEQADVAVDPAVSYYVMSSPYLRPDPNWTVHGTVQLRHADGSVASSAEASALRLHVKGGLIRKELSHVRAGTWRFAIAAPAGSAGRGLELDVRYAGVSLGARTMPIGVDAWMAGTGVKAVGGCSLVVGAENERGRAWVWLALASLLGCSSRRRRQA